MKIAFAIVCVIVCGSDVKGRSPCGHAIVFKRPEPIQTCMFLCLVFWGIGGVVDLGWLSLGMRLYRLVVAAALMLGCGRRAHTDHIILL